MRVCKVMVPDKVRNAKIDEEKAYWEVIDQVEKDNEKSNYRHQKEQFQQNEIIEANQSLQENALQKVLGDVPRQTTSKHKFKLDAPADSDHKPDRNTLLSSINDRFEQPREMSRTEVHSFNMQAPKMMN